MRALIILQSPQFDYQSLTEFGARAGGRGYSSVEEDLQKIEEYSKKGKNAHFVMLDEDCRHARKIQGDCARASLDCSLLRVSLTH